VEPFQLLLHAGLSRRYPNDPQAATPPTTAASTTVGRAHTQRNLEPSRKCLKPGRQHRYSDSLPRLQQSRRPRGRDRQAIPELCPRHNRRPPTDDQWLVRPLFSKTPLAQKRFAATFGAPDHGPERERASVCQRHVPPTVQAPPKASARAPAQLPYRSMTVDGAGHSPACSRLSGSPPRRRACVRDQSYEDGAAP